MHNILVTVLFFVRQCHYENDKHGWRRFELYCAFFSGCAKFHSNGTNVDEILIDERNNRLIVGAK